MKNLKELEVIEISTRTGQMMALVSYQDPNDLDSPTNGFDNIFIPVNLRDIQYSSRGNMLVDQSVKVTADVSSK